MEKVERDKKINNSYKKLIGRILGLSEGFFKENIEKEKWLSYRKLLLDVVNAESRQLVADLDGRNYYHLKVKRREHE